MVFLNSDGTMIRSYCGLTGATNNGSGILSGRLVIVPGMYNVTFPFDISSRFFCVSVENYGFKEQVAVSFQRYSNTALQIFTRTLSNVLTDRPV